MRILVILGSPRDLVCTLLSNKKNKQKQTKQKQKTKQKKKKKQQNMPTLKYVTRSYLEAYFSMRQI